MKLSINKLKSCEFSFKKLKFTLHKWCFSILNKVKQWLFFKCKAFVTDYACNHFDPRLIDPTNRIDNFPHKSIEKKSFFLVCVCILTAPTATTRWRSWQKPYCTTQAKWCGNHQPSTNRFVKSTLNTFRLTSKRATWNSDRGRTTDTWWETVNRWWWWWWWRRPTQLSRLFFLSSW